MPSVLIVKTGDAFPDVVEKHGDVGVLFEAPHSISLLERFITLL